MLAGKPLISSFFLDPRLNIFTALMCCFLLLSKNIISLTPATEPNLESPASVDCSKLYRDNRPEYERRVRESIREQLGL
jgi:hypothetical protein